MDRRAEGLTPETLLACYRAGVFPMGEARDDPRLFLVDPPWRGVLPLDGFHMPRRLARTVRQERFVVEADRDFDTVVTLCAAPAEGREDSWINDPVRELYGELHRNGWAHSIECRLEGELVGGLYGVSIGAAFFGESMFSRRTDASKVALAHLVARLKSGGYRLLDTQFLTEHLQQFGVLEIARRAYHAQLAAALPQRADFYAAGAALTGAGVLQAISHRS